MAAKPNRLVPEGQYAALQVDEWIFVTATCQLGAAGLDVGLKEQLPVGKSELALRYCYSDDGYHPQVETDYFSVVSKHNGPSVLQVEDGVGKHEVPIQRVPVELARPVPGLPWRSVVARRNLPVYRITSLGDASKLPKELLLYEKRLTSLDDSWQTAGGTHCVPDDWFGEICYPCVKTRALRHELILRIYGPAQQDVERGVHECLVEAAIVSALGAIVAGFAVGAWAAAAAAFTGLLADCLKRKAIEGVRVVLDAPSHWTDWSGC